ncbi:MAG TPA: adenosine deaminase [Acidimicrobiia bacterium]|nr:adenosine deaminase [Acidimicrobiia bacterium]
MKPEEVRALPKVLLHDHLDGGLRPQTILDLASDAGYDRLPFDDAASLARWFHQDGSFSLERYLEAFAHTFGVMQTPQAVARVAYEAASDLAAEGVVYAEIRFAPTLHLERGMSRTDVLEAAIDGFSRAEADTGLPVRILVDALRQQDDSVEVAEAAASFAGEGVVGFDLAGPEAGFPPSLHAEAIEIARRGGLRITIHAGEGDGVGSIRAALDQGAERIGHGARIIEDTTVEDGEIVELGPVATEVRDRGIALELCPYSNLDTGMYPTAADHPIGLLYRAGFTTTINTDNRLMSATSMSREFTLAVEDQGFDRDDLRAITLNAVEAAFCDEETRSRVRERVEAGYANG